jgi:NADH:ubiquinone oxidoreductase subunit 6 (subunit J)
MKLAFGILALLTAGSAVAAVTFRNLVHCALFLIVAFAGLAGLYLQLSAQFVGFAQVLVYIGAVAILIVFAILLTRGAAVPEASVLSNSWGAGFGIAALCCAVLVGTAIFNSDRFAAAQPGVPVQTLVRADSAVPGASATVVKAPLTGTVRDIGRALMTDYVLPLEVIAVLLTAALIGAVIISMPERGGKA